ncbi:MAG: DUF1003 domain-containing protein [Bacillota bacterium]
MERDRQLSEIARLEAEIHRQIQARQAKNVNTIRQGQLTFGDRLADGMASFTGSWTFLMLFIGALFVWVAVNTFWAFSDPFDPYPFILLNLVLATVTAIQAPLIMMSQNRQAAKDRVRAEIEYQVNLKSEVILEHLHDTIERSLSEIEDRLAAIEERAGVPEGKRVRIPSDSADFDQRHPINRETYH